MDQENKKKQIKKTGRAMEKAFYDYVQGSVNLSDNVLKSRDINFFTDVAERRCPDILVELERLSVLNASQSNLKDYIGNVVDMVWSFVDGDVVSVKLFEGESSFVCHRYITDRNGSFVDERVVAIEEKYSDVAVKSKEFFWADQLDFGCEYRSIVSFPLLFRGALLGVVSVLFKRKIQPNTKGIAGLKVCASNLALMVQNSRLYASLTGNQFNIIRALIVSLEARDEYTHGHSQRVTEYALKIARKMQCGKKEIKLLQEVAPLHDIGKIAIPDAILNKIEPLTDDEFVEIRSHAVKGSIMLESVGFNEESVKLVRCHHEAYNGRGYPDRLKGEDISLAGRILCVADAYDAMVSNRPYKKRMTKQEAHAELQRCSGTQFCPKVIDSFFQIKM